MGLFDKLFGKNNQGKTQEPVQQPTKNDVFDGIYIAKPVSVEAPVIFKTFTYEEIESLIDANPLAASYRLDRQQQTFSMNTMEWEQFKAKAKKSFIALDLETTGLHNDDDNIIEVAAVKVKDGEIIDSYQQYVNPNKPIPEDAKAVNHITDDMLIGKPYIFQIIPDLLAFIGNDIIAAHNAPFDIGFLAQACMRYRFKIPRKWFDTMDLKEVWPGLKSKKLQSFLDAAGIENRQAHSAAGDAEALALLIIKSLDKESL